jgi:hypothetical protein
MRFYSQIEKIHKKYFGKNYYFLISMSVLHALIILYIIFGFKFNYPVFFTLSLSGISTANIFNMNFGNGSAIWGYIYAYLLILCIFLIDVGFLVILMFEFEWIRLSYKRILLIEIILISISFFIPFFRNMMFFLSLNTIQIYVIYRIIFKIPLMNYAFIFGSYLMVFKLILKPIALILWGKTI